MISKVIKHGYEYHQNLQGYILFFKKHAQSSPSVHMARSAAWTSGNKHQYPHCIFPWLSLDLARILASTSQISLGFINPKMSNKDTILPVAYKSCKAPLE